MTLFLILAPYGVYAFLMLVTSATVSLVGAGAVCLATIALDAWHGRSLKILPSGTVIVFAGILAWLHLIDPSLNERSFWWYMLRVYLLAPFNSRFGSVSKRLERINAHPPARDSVTAGARQDAR